jgi:predicted nucleic acid-binding protein
LQVSMSRENNTMTEESCLIDTDILIYILKRKEPAYQRSREHLAQHKKFTMSCLTYYECLRGYKAIGATKRLQVFRELLDITEVLYLDQTILDKAGEIYGVLRR